jgi:hypothetical protein
MKVKVFSELLSKYRPKPHFLNVDAEVLNVYKPTPYLTHPFLQSIYNLAEPAKTYNYER